MNNDFLKLNAGGNDFICINNMDDSWTGLLDSRDIAPYIIKWCRRGLDIGADGVMFACPANVPNADLRVRFFDPDGTEFALCGNGSVCFAKWALAEKLVQGTSVAISTNAGIVNAVESPDCPGYFRINVPEPFGYKWDLSVEVEGRMWKFDYICPGVEHAVVRVDDVNALDVNHWGGLIRRHEMFAGQAGVNVNFVQVLEKGKLVIRTFEYGVEAETLACGTGSMSSAIITSVREGWEECLSGKMPVCLHLRGGEKVRVWFVWKDGRAANVSYENRPVIAYRGRY